MILVPALVALVRFVLSGVAAQGTNVTSCINEYEWTIDAAGHTPCWTAAQLYMPCGIGNKFLQAIPPDTVYLGPNSTHQDECGCSSAVYILTSACGACQGRPWVNYDSWARECPAQMKSIGYPKDVPIRVTIPEWAKMNVSELAGQNFDPAKARMEASAFHGRGKVKVGAIAGGVFAFLTALGLLIVWLIRRKRARIAQLGELRARSLDLAELDHLYHDSERAAAGFLGAKTRPRGYSSIRKGRTLSVSMVRGRSWHLLESSERQLSVSSGGHGNGQAYVFIIPEHNTVAPVMREVATRGQQPMSVDIPPPSYQTHVGRLSVDSLSPPPSLSQGFFDSQGVCHSPPGVV